MQPRSPGIRLLFAALLVSTAVDVAAQSGTGPVPGSLRDTYPAGSIDDAAKADAALAATAGVRDHIEREYKSNANECAKAVMVNLCLDRARDLRRRRFADVEGVELEANRTKRRDKADRIEADRVKREAERAANAPADADLRARNRKTFDDKTSQASRDAASRARSDAAHGLPQKPHRSVVKVAPPADAEANATLRAKNAAAHALKVKEANEHLVEIERRAASKAADRKRRDEEKAAKEAKEAKAAATASAAARP